MDPKSVLSKIVECASVGRLPSYIEPYVVLPSGRPDDHILISFSLSVHEALRELRAKLKIDITVAMRFVRAPTNAKE
jgi:hypothetical protein